MDALRPVTVRCMRRRSWRASIRVSLFRLDTSFDGQLPVYDALTKGYILFDHRVCLMRHFRNVSVGKITGMRYQVSKIIAKSGVVFFPKIGSDLKILLSKNNWLEYSIYIVKKESCLRFMAQIYSAIEFWYHICRIRRGDGKSRSAMQPIRVHAQFTSCY